MTLFWEKNNMSTVPNLTKDRWEILLKLHKCFEDDTDWEKHLINHYGGMPDYDVKRLIDEKLIYKHGDNICISGNKTSKLFFSKLGFEAVEFYKDAEINRRAKDIVKIHKLNTNASVLETIITLMKEGVIK